ncbi:MAG: tyrosine-type recombinase/integrase [Deltaproteobacteria bacterium]|nr:tyrosine-type recombinase/integrase [Deltaproteobacteria bacterium]
MNYADAIRQPPKTLTEQEQQLLLKVSGEHHAGFRDHVIYSLALGTGLREHEIVALNIGDIFHEDGRVKRRIQLMVFKRSSSDPRDQEVILPETARYKLEKFYRWKQRLGQNLEADAPVFISRNSNRLSTRQVRHSFSVWQERAGFDRRLSFHALRHTACTNLYRNTKDIRITQRFARHKSIFTTAIYAHPSDEDMLRSVRELFC